MDRLTELVLQERVSCRCVYHNGERVVPLLFSRQCFFFLSIENGTLFMSNQILKRFYFENLDFHLKNPIEKYFQSWLLWLVWVLEKKLLKSSIIIRIHQIYYRISYTKIQSFENLVVFSSGQLWSPLSLRIFDENPFFTNRYRISFGINNIASRTPKTAVRGPWIVSEWQLRFPNIFFAKCPKHK